MVILVYSAYDSESSIAIITKIEGITWTSIKYNNLGKVFAFIEKNKNFFHLYNF
jgi:hypothetical protein